MPLIYQSVPSHFRHTYPSILASFWKSSFMNVLERYSKKIQVLCNGNPGPREHDCVFLSPCPGAIAQSGLDSSIKMTMNGKWFESAQDSEWHTRTAQLNIVTDTVTIRLENAWNNGINAFCVRGSILGDMHGNVCLMILQFFNLHVCYILRLKVTFPSPNNQHHSFWRGAYLAHSSGDVSLQVVSVRLGTVLVEGLLAHSGSLCDSGGAERKSGVWGAVHNLQAPPLGVSFH